MTNTCGVSWAANLSACPAQFRHTMDREPGSCAFTGWLTHDTETRLSGRVWLHGPAGAVAEE